MVGTVTRAEPFLRGPQAPAIKMWIRLAPRSERRKTSAQITVYLHARRFDGTQGDGVV